MKNLKNLFHQFLKELGFFLITTLLALIGIALILTVCKFIFPSISLPMVCGVLIVMFVIDAIIRTLSKK